MMITGFYCVADAAQHIRVQGGGEQQLHGGGVRSHDERATDRVHLFQPEHGEVETHS